ncbi:MAG: hypothetical protein EOS11_16825 [Mesorhizobium sp.]|nr:MAG: hypothetical protein EOR98_07960 [Mesorhizobium sp.]RWN77939.1 MAG: hypothetical protein EOS02_09220 [Mesorhizobium sp.]RWN81922.1 MAG: hypothetical protein EOS01_08020 [Mesorhizobium sp.]RWN91289.1 MAG: hypothetical protein EOS04_03985 [Mesorhizobium sp.]RWO15712.1 MAG: hypothetical protein EOS15_08030 [Mesorhizobium sp.]
MCQRRPADPTDPGDAADLNHGVFFGSIRRSTLAPVPSSACTFAQQPAKINNFLTKPGESLALR